MLLDSGWKLADFAPTEGAARSAFAPEFDDAAWLAVAVPGDVHRTLLTAGRIPDPFWDQNEQACAWLEEREWWYRLTFVAPPEPLAPGERLRLVFHGLDTFATVWLNGQALGEHANMFRPAEFDASPHVRAGEPNTLAIRFDPPLRRVVAPTQSPWRSEPRSAMRKAQFGYGWDWGPRLPTIGIWRPAELLRDQRARLLGVHVSTVELSEDRSEALLAVRLEIDRFAAGGALAAHVRLDDVDLDLDLQDRTDVTSYVTLARPRLWWTHDLGEPALYQLDVQLREGDVLLDEHAARIGVRTLELDQSPDPEEWGARFFRFVLNGVPVFARGANWIPCDSFVGAIPSERYTRLLEAARAANMTMLRVWGGGIYEHDAFYAECDRLGLLVWQDFMFACASYPEEAAFAAEVEAEARYQVRRLRGHPSLALWCGNNENQWLIERALWDQPALPPYGAQYYDEVLPRVVRELDGRTPYWPSSPYGGTDHNGREDGDVHNWEVWHGQYPRRFGEQPRREFTPASVSFLRYADDLGRFISEFGMHAAPPLETLRRAVPENQLWHHSPALDWHNKDNPKNKGDQLMLGSTGLPSNLEEYIDFSQIAQAEGLKFGVEHFRRRKPHCSGTLVWQLNDCWPVLSWSVLDYFGFPKASYFALRRAYAPVLASFKPRLDGLELWITNDSLTRVVDTARVELRGFDGRHIFEEDVALDVAPNSSQRAAAWSAQRVPAMSDGYISVSASNASLGWNRHFFVPIKDLVRPRPNVVVEWQMPTKDALELTLRTDRYALFVHLETSDAAVRMSDNYFDIPPGETRRVVLSHPERRLEPGEFSVRWR